MKTAAEVVTGRDLSGSTVVITGASSGLGLESARVLAAGGAHVVLAARNVDALTATIDAIRAEIPAARLSGVGLDLTSLASVRAAAAQIAAAAPVINVLMNNAGVMFTPFGRTDDGFEMQFGTNHLGHFALTSWLTPQFVEGTRIINLSSDGHRRSDRSQLATSRLRQVRRIRRRQDRQHPARRGARSSIARAGRRRVCRTSGHGGHQPGPAHVPGGCGRSRWAGRAHAIEVWTPEQGAATQVWAAVSPELDGRGGLYLADCAVRTDAEAYATDPERSEKLWEISESLCTG